MPPPVFFPLNGYVPDSAIKLGDETMHVAVLTIRGGKEKREQDGHFRGRMLVVASGKFSRGPQTAS